MLIVECDNCVDTFVYSQTGLILTMNKILRLLQWVIFSGKSAALAGSLLVLAACSGSEPAKEILVEAVPTAMTTTETAQPVSADKPLHLSFEDSSTFVYDHSSLLFRGHHTVKFMPDQGHLQLGSVLVEKRQESWHGPLLTLPKLDPGKAYRASVWIKLLDSKQPAEVKLILIRVAGGTTTNVVLNRLLIEPGSWQKIDGEFIGANEWSDDITALTLDVVSVDTQYLIDDVMVSHAELSDELEAAAARSRKPTFVRNGDLEEGMEHWGRQGGVISRTTAQAHSGSHSLLIAGRTETWHAPTLAMHGLEDSKKYKISVFVRLNEGEQPVTIQLTLKRVTNGQESFLPIASAGAYSSRWVEVSGIFSAPNVSESEQVVLYLESDSATASYFVDTLTVKEAP